MISKERVRVGMRVRSSQGSRYGKVIGRGEETFRLRHGHFGAVEFDVPYADAIERDGDLWLDLHGDFPDERRARDGLSAVSSGPARRRG